MLDQGELKELEELKPRNNYISGGKRNVIDV